MTVEFKNHRICVYSSGNVELTEDENPPVLVTGGSLHVGQTHLEEGRIIITARRILFESINVAIGFDYRSMVMHAITSDEQTGGGRRYIFVQLLADEDEDQEAEDEIIKLIPSDESLVETLFSTINEMSALNPDEADIEDEEAF